MSHGKTLRHTGYQRPFEFCDVTAPKPVPAGRVTKITRRIAASAFALAGVMLFFPGKWQVAPLAVPVWFLPRKKGFFPVKFQDFISIAGVGDRPDIHALFINPTLNYIPARRWLVQADAESRTNWKDYNRTDFRVGFGAGRVMTRRVFLGIKCEVPIGETRSGDWTMKVISVLYR